MVTATAGRLMLERIGHHMRYNDAVFQILMLPFKSKLFCHESHRSSLSRRRCRSGHHHRRVRFDSLYRLFHYAIAMTGGRSLNPLGLRWHGCE